MSYPESKTRRGRVQEGGKISPTLMAGGDAPCYYEGTAKTLCLNSKVDGKQPSLEHRIYDAEGISTAMTTGFRPSIKEPTFYRIRKLTPRECFRLMGVSESDIDKIQQSGVSQSQQYKMAGNSIVVDVLEHIFRKMFVDTGQESQQLSLF
jgi:DNA (cytosine-5)-methyltransferase 1